MDYTEQLLLFEREAKASALAKAPEAFTRFPECSFCLGREPLSQHENNSTDEVTEYWIIWEYVTWQNVHQFRHAHRLIHKKHGFLIEMHDCPDLGDWTFKLLGPLPLTRDAIKELSAFITYAVNVAETRGRRAQISIEAIIECLRRLPKNAGLTRLAAEMDLPTRTIQYTLKAAGMTFKQAKQKAQE